MDYINYDEVFIKAKSCAVNFISYKIRTRNEVMSKLKKEGYDSEIAERVAEELVSLGYIDDLEYAKRFIADRCKLKPISKSLIFRELGNRGISLKIIEEAMSCYSINEEEIVKNLIRKRFGKYDLCDEKIKKKVYSFLAYRGFSYEIIKSALEEMNKLD